mgnify:CR=1 FL=1
MDLATDQLLLDTGAEMAASAAKHPWWPRCPFQALTILNEEVGELNKAVLQFSCEPEKCVTRADIRAEAIQVAAMALTFILHMDNYSDDPKPTIRR